MSNNQFYRDLYNKVYDMGYHKGTSITHANELICFFFEKNKNKIKIESILDCGTSIGNTLVKIKEKTDKMPEYSNMNPKLKISGFDVSDIAVKKGQERGLDIFRSSITDINLPDDSYQCLISSDVLEHLYPSDMKKAIEEMIRVSKQYIGLKLAYCKDSNKFLPKLKEKDPNIKIDNLHLTIQQREWYINLIEEVLQEKNIKYKEHFYNKNHAIFEIFKDKV